jgi:hypothetical protein
MRDEREKWDERDARVLLWLTEGPYVLQHLPGFFFRQYERNEGSHGRSLAAILQNPEQFPIGSSGLPSFVGKISR